MAKRYKGGIKQLTGKQQTPSPSLISEELSVQELQWVFVQELDAASMSLGVPSVNSLIAGKSQNKGLNTDDIDNIFSTLDSN